jgi:Zn-finger nucleic acid-binding protein
MSTPYRKAGVQGRDTERCLFCGTRFEAHVTCPSCGEEAPPADAPRAEALHVSCPRCFIGLELEKPTGDEGAFLYCIGCHGCFVPPVDWGLILEHAAHAAGSKDKDTHVAGEELKALPPEQGLTRGALTSEINCPVCRLQMFRFRYAGREEVDVCKRHGIWFDAAELASVLRESARPPSTEESPKAAPATADAPKEDKRQKQRSAIGVFARMLLG